MEETGKRSLPDPDILRRHILTRDFSIYEPKEGDTEQQLTKKAEGMAMLEDIMDYYTDSLVPCCAGAKLFHPKIRHFDSMTEVLMPNGGEGQLRTTAATEAFAILTCCAGAKLFHPKIRHFDSMTEVLMPNGGEGQLRITAATEAFAILTYMNNHKKWEAIRDCQAKNPNSATKCPRYSKKKPTENEEFKAEYSDSQTGTPFWGGWSEEGRKLFGVLQREVLASREANKERHVQRDKESVARLHEKFADLHKNDHRQPKKAKITNEVEREYDEDLEYVDEE